MAAHCGTYIFTIDLSITLCFRKHDTAPTTHDTAPTTHDTATPTALQLTMGNWSQAASETPIDTAIKMAIFPGEEEM